MISTVRTATINIIFFSVFPLSGWHAQEGVSICNHEFEWTHGGKMRGTHFTCIWLYQLLDHNCGREVVLLHYLPVSSPRSPVGPGEGLGPGIRTWFGTINCVPE